MTRFARAKGSKSSNKREPEEASSWQQMKEGLLTKPDARSDKQQEISDSLKRKEILKTLKQNEPVSWSAFEEVSGGANNKPPKKKKDTAKVGEKLISDDSNGIKKKKIKANGESVKLENGNEKKMSKKRKSIEGDLESTNGHTNIKKKKKALKGDSEQIDTLESQNTDEDNEKTSKKNNKKKKKTLKGNTEQIDTLKSQNTDEGNEKTSKKKNKKKKESSKGDSQQDDTLETQNTNEGNEKTSKKKNKKKKTQDNNQNGGSENNLNKESSAQNNNINSKKIKTKKEFKNRRKPAPQPYQIDINGEMVDVVTYDGFPILKEDAARLDELKKSLFAKGIPHGEIKKIMKLQRRNAEKALSRAKKRVCFNCRKSGHNLSECPVLNQGEGTGICFKCGSTEHTHFECKVVKKQEFKFAQCFICKEQGHISNQCPDNPRGLYPKGGACKLCGDVTHLKRFCPTLPKDSEPTIDNFLDEDVGSTNTIKRNKPNVTPKKHIKF